MISALVAAGYRPLSKDVLFSRGWHCEVSFDRSGKHAAIALYPSPGGDYALNVKAMQDIVAALDKGQIDSAKLYLADRQRSRAIFVIALSEMALRLEGKAPRDGDRGPYHWVNSRGQCTADVDELEDAPFPVDYSVPM